MTIINYTQEYEREVVDLWNRTCTFDPISVQKFRLQALFDDNFDPELAHVAIEDNKVVGFIYGTKRKFPYLERGLEPDRGWINVMFVDKDYRNRGIGQALYDKVESQLKELGCKNITLCAYSPSYFFAGLDAEHYPESISFFEKNGHVRGAEHYSMGKNLHGFQIPERTLKKKKEAEDKGYQFLVFDYKHSLELLDFLKREFGGGWKRNALMAMQKGEAEERILIVLNKENKICGFCTRAIDDNPMRFGPIGVAANERNSGIGSILLDMQCFEMAKKGIYRMYFVTTEENGRRYYERNGLSVIRTFIDYRKEL